MHKIVVVFYMLACLLISCQSCQACSRALHDWQLNFYAKIDLPSPILPLAEFDVSINRAIHGNFKVLWLVNRQWYNFLQLAFFPILYKGMANSLPTVSNLPESERIRPWYLLPKNESVGELAFRNAQNKDSSLILGSDRNSLRIAFFTDTNSSGSCFQLVLIQDGRLRAVHVSPKNPWAQEINSKSYLSLIFFQLPVPGRIMNLSVYPVNSARMTLVEDEALTIKLLENKLLLPRSTSDYDPESNEIPELPE